jgi:hypothetical protein
MSIPSLSAAVSSTKNNITTLQEKFFVRTIKPLTPEQWSRSLCIATNQIPNDDEEREFIRQYLSELDSWRL